MTHIGKESTLQSYSATARPRHPAARNSGTTASKTISTGSSSTRLRGRSPRSTTRSWDGRWSTRTRNGIAAQRAALGAVNAHRLQKAAEIVIIRHASPAPISVIVTVPSTGSSVALTLTSALGVSRWQFFTPSTPYRMFASFAVYTASPSRSPVKYACSAHHSERDN